MKLDYRPDMVKFASEITVNETNLDRSALDQAGLMSYYCSQRAMARRQLAKCQLKLDILTANLYNVYKQRLVSSEERITDKQIESLIRSDKRWQISSLERIEAQEIASQLDACVNALIERKKTIQQLLDDRHMQAGGAVKITQEVENPFAP